jgi:capsular exopolysaccharide synthesis family protein
MIYRRRFLVAGILLGSMLVAVLMIVHSKRSYTATATILVEPSAPQLLGVKELENGEAPGTYEHDYYETEYDILKSRSLAAQVIRQLDLTHNDFFLQKSASVGLRSESKSKAAAKTRTQRVRVTNSASPSTVANRSEASATEIAHNDGLASSESSELVDRYLARLEIKPRIGTRLVTVSYSAPDARLAARIANAHVEAYITRGMELHSEASRKAEEYLQKKVSELKSEAEQSEAVLNAYRRSHGIVGSSVGDEGSRVLLERLSGLNVDLSKTEDVRIYLESEHQQIKHGDYESLPEVIRSPLIGELKQEAAKIAQEYASMRNRYNPGYHPLDDLHAKLEDSHARLRHEIQIVIGGVESDYSIQTAREQGLQAEIRKVTAESMARNDAALHEAVLERQVDTSRGLYQNVLRRMEEIGITANRPSSNVSFLDRADPPEASSSPRVILDLAKGASVGLIGGLGLAFLFEYFDDSLKSREEVEVHLRIPALGQVPDFARLRRLAQPRKDPIVIGAENRLALDANQSGAVAEAFRAIRNTILFSHPDGKPRSILITSALSGEGKTSTAINTAIAFARLTGHILLIDADLRRPKCHKVLEVENEPGLTELLSGERRTDQVIQETKCGGLFLLTAGGEVSNPGELLASANMRELLSELVIKYEHVLIDSAPVIPVSDTEGLSTLVDAAVVVANSTSSKQTVQSACARLEVVGANIIGVVLNRVGSTLGYYDYSYRTSDAADRPVPG